jgi:hypothetical protein
MCVQLSLFDAPYALVNDRTASMVRESSEELVQESSPKQVESAEQVSPVRIYGDSRRGDSIQPMGDLARLVLARYDMVARRREELMRRRAEQPRKSIRVLSPAS